MAMGRVLLLAVIGLGSACLPTEPAAWRVAAPKQDRETRQPIPEQADSFLHRGWDPDMSGRRCAPPVGVVEPLALRVGRGADASRLLGHTTIARAAGCEASWWVRVVCRRGDHLLVDRATIAAKGERQGVHAWAVSLDVSDPDGAPPDACTIASYLATEPGSQRVAQHCWRGTEIHGGACDPGTPPPDAPSVPPIEIVDATADGVEAGLLVRMRFRSSGHRKAKAPALRVRDGRTGKATLDYRWFPGHVGAHEDFVASALLPPAAPTETFEVHIEARGFMDDYDSVWCHRGGNLHAGACP
jgi:hypothetical protein